MKKNNKNYLIIGIIVLFTFILYGNTIRNKYSLDDDFVTYNNPTIQKGIKAIPEIFTSLYTAREGLTYGYRPVVKVSYAIEYEFFGQNPHISHLINILIYAFTCVLLFFILKNLLKNYNIIFPIAITALFIAHPVHTEVVCSLKNRDELFSFLGCLAALHFFIKYAEKDKLKYILAGLFFYLFALLSKLTALTFVVIFPLILYFFTNTSKKKILYVFLSVFVIALIAKYAPKLYLPPADRQKLFFENPLFFEDNIWERIGTGCFTLIYYIKLLIFPHPLRFYYGYNQIPIVDFTNTWAIISAIIHLIIFIFAILKFKKKNILSFAILYYLICISMFSNIAKPAMGIVAERFLYSASLGFCIILTYFLFKLLKISLKNNVISTNVKTKIIFLSLIILLPYSIKTIDRNKDWKNYSTLYFNDIKYLNNSAKANAILAEQLLKEIKKDVINNRNRAENENKIKLVIKYYKQAINIYPEYPTALYNLGSIYSNVYRDYQTALKYYKKSLGTDSLHFKTYFNIGVCYEKLYNYKEAIKYYKNTLEIKSDYQIARERLDYLKTKFD